MFHLLLTSSMNKSIQLNDNDDLNEVVNSFNEPTNIENSFSIGDIMQQQSTMGLDAGSGTMNTSVTNSMTPAAEQSSRMLIGVVLPRTSAYVL
jgi:hypothetical protein